MAEKTVLLFGANGQVGHELLRTLLSFGRVVPLDVPQIDFCNEAALREVVRDYKPTVIVNAAAYTAVDKAEGDPEVAFAVNATAPSVLAEEATVLNACLVHYSTDYVFDGSKAQPYVESDRTNPLSVYGKSKLEGERGVATCPRHLILRTSWVISTHGHNFLKTMLRLAAERDTLRVVADQFGAPTSAALLAEATANVLSVLGGASAADPRWGLYHLAAAGETSWYGLAHYAIARGWERRACMKARPEDVVPITTGEYPTPARRPHNSRLDTSKFRAAFGVELLDWTIGVDQAVSSLLEESRT